MLSDQNKKITEVDCTGDLLELIGADGVVTELAELQAGVAYHLLDELSSLDNIVFADSCQLFNLSGINQATDVIFEKNVILRGITKGFRLSGCTVRTGVRFLDSAGKDVKLMDVEGCEFHSGLILHGCDHLFNKRFCEMNSLEGGVIIDGLMPV